MTQPASIPTDGFLGVLWVPSLANPLAPTVTEVNAVSRVDISCYLTGGGYANATEEATINDPRLCSRQDLEQPGKIKHTLGLMYVHNPKAPAENACYLALTRDALGFIVARYGVPFDDPWAAGDIVDVSPVKCGYRVKVPSEENAVFKISQKLYLTGELAEDAVIV